MTNLIFTLSNKTKDIKDSRAELLSITRESIKIRTKLKVDDFSVANVCLICGNGVKIVFFLTDLKNVTKDGAYQVYEFHAPKKKPLYINSINLKTYECCGYDKLYAVMHPKHVGKKVAS